jgi:hypothetical protein
MADRLQDELSPDGETLVQWSESDGRMSHVIRTPTMIDAASGETILRLGDSGYDATIGWGEHGGFDLDLRHYWRAGTLRLTIDRATGIFRIAGADDAAAPHPLGTLSAFVEAHFATADREAAAQAARQMLARMVTRQRRGGAWALWILLAIGVGAGSWALFFRG